MIYVQANPLKPPVVSESKPKATDEVTIRCEAEGSGSVFAIHISQRQAYGKSCMKKVANVYLTVTIETAALDSVLKPFLTNGMIDYDDYSQIKEIMTKKEILFKHQVNSKIAQHKDGRWRTYVKLPDGKRKLLVARSEALLHDMIVDYYKGSGNKEYYIPTFLDCYRKWRELHDLTLSGNTRAKYDSDFKRYFEGEAFVERPISEITEEEIERFIFEKIISLKLCREAVKSFVCYVKGTFRSAKKNRFITEDPAKDIQRSYFYKRCTDVEKPLEAVLIPDQDWAVLYEQIQKDIKKNPCYFPPYAILLAALTGMRVGELSALKWEDIQTDPVSGRTYIGICRSESYDCTTKEYYIRDVKNHKTRVYPVSTQIHELLMKIRTVCIQNDMLNEWVFPEDNPDGHVHKRNICDCLKNRCKKLGMQTKGMHAFRRQINSDMRCDGVSSVITSSLIGNSEAVNRKHYTFDVSNLEEKERIVEMTNQKRIAIANQA